MSDRGPGGWRGPVLLSAGGHLILGVALLVSLDWHQPVDLSSPAQGEVIQATSVAAEEIESARAEIAERERQRQAEQEAAERRAREQAEAERQRREEARRQAAAEEQRRQEAAEARRQAEAEAERQRQAEAEAEAERQRQAEEERRRREAEEQRRREEEAARQAAEEAERRRQEEAEQALREAAEAEAERRRQAERRARLQSLEEQYVAELQAHVERHWIRPGDVPDGLVCVVVAQQIPGGEVVDVAVRDCNAPANVIRSIENAVYRSSPLPSPPDEAVFARTIQFRFRGDSA